MRYVVLLGRILFSLMFVTASFGHFTAGTIGYAAAQGVPLASIAVPVSGVMALLGGLSVAFGYKARFGASLLVLFLVPVTIVIHRFWGLPDAHAALMQQIMFLKNLSMLGGAPLIPHLGSGPLSLATTTNLRYSHYPR